LTVNFVLIFYFWVFFLGKIKMCPSERLEQILMYCLFEVFLQYKFKYYAPRRGAFGGKSSRSRRLLVRPGAKLQALRGKTAQLLPPKNRVALAQQKIKDTENVKIK
jgi:hypothetical protein